MARMKIYTFQAEQWLPLPPEKLFPFFADAANLDVITPPWLNFRTITPLPISMRPGTLIDYRLRLRGIPIRWQSEITAWDPPWEFTDEQRRGPYRLWKHHHTFKERDGGTVAGDCVEYAHWGGSFVNHFLVAPDVRRIFHYREEKLKSLFTPPR